MKFTLFRDLYGEALVCTNLEMYITERGWQDWMDAYADNDDNDASKIAEILERIYSLAHMDIGQLRSETKLSASAFSVMFGIPIRTAQSWEYKERRTPAYALLLISYAIFMEGIDDEQD